ncbi:MAG: OmpH family outer membrane protein [Deltaproteobacteria bacterium]|nr:OmpH family outer membrane protein [Deltaproteobacteria bacterium]
MQQLAVLRLADVVANSQLGRDAEKELQARLDDARARVAAAERNATLAEAEARRVAADPRQAAAKTREAARLRREVAHLQQESEIALSSLRQDLLNQALAQIQPLVSEVAREVAASIVLLAPNPGLAHYAPEVDITDRVLQRLGGPAADADPKDEAKKKTSARGSTAR